MGERRKSFKIWLKRTRDRGVVEGSRPRAQKNIRGQRQPFQGQTFSRARTQAQVFSKKDSNNTVFKNFFHAFLKKRSKIFSGDLKKQNQKISKKTNFSTKNDLQNFKDSKNTAVLEPRTAICENLKR